MRLPVELLTLCDSGLDQIRRQVAPQFVDQAHSADFIDMPGGWMVGYRCEDLQGAPSEPRRSGRLCEGGGLT
ncbi:MAG TPA: hypothetical protein VFU22_31965 [Roseiflexaceae bacterium]|nr:hypothetical protein [Roseiflexaceae bacterium]